MKVAVSIPDEVYEEADRVAARKQLNRSELYTRALRRLLAEEAEDELTRRIDATCDSSSEDLAPLARADLIETSLWEW
jgi:metal-responsive CopG/Arc/MetJ family transcriptional regulator